MSLIKKIVEIVDKTESVDARKNITKLNKEVKEYQEKVQKYIDHNYVDFLPDIANNEMYLDSGEQLQETIKSLQQNFSNETINQVYSAQNEISKFLDDLDEISLALNISLSLMKIDAFLQQINQLNENENYAEVNNQLISIDLILKDPQNKIIQKLDMYENLKLRLDYEYQKMMVNLQSKFESLVQMTEKTFPSTKAITVTIPKKKEVLKKTVETLYDADFNFKKISDFFMSNLFEPSIKKPVSLEVLESDKEYLLNLSFTNKPVSEDLRPNYKIVFSNMKHLLYFLVNMNVCINGQINFLELLFETAKDKFIDMLIEDCITHSIPDTIEQRNESTMKEDILKLNKLFTDMHFIQTQRLEEFAQEIDDLFQNRFSQNILEKSSEIMKRDLHDMMLMDVNTSQTDCSPFPRCMISKSTVDIISLIEKVLKQANSTTSETMAENLRLAVDSVLQNYAFIIQQHHSKFLSKIPQQTALFYNNCCYLTYWIATNQLTDGAHLEVAAKSLEREGREIFESQIDKQKVALADILVDFQLLSTLTVLAPENIKPIRQCLRQMDLLKNVWQTILPIELYNKTMGELLDVLCYDVIKKICILEDISSTLCSGLVEMIKMISEKGTLLFEDESSVSLNVEHWKKMLSLKFVLDASMVEITENWKSGKLSQTFKAEEIKHLIRALFQNTDRRANALSSIV